MSHPDLEIRIEHAVRCQECYARAAGEYAEASTLADANPSPDRWRLASLAREDFDYAHRDLRIALACLRDAGGPKAEWFAQEIEKSYAANADLAQRLGCRRAIDSISSLSGAA